MRPFQFSNCFPPRSSQRVGMWCAESSVYAMEEPSLAVPDLTSFSRMITVSIRAAAATCVRGLVPVTRGIRTQTMSLYHYVNGE